MADRILDHDNEMRSPSGFTYEELRNRINARVRKPCAGRFGGIIDIHTEFEQDCLEFRQLLGLVSRQFPLDDWEQFNISADLDWLEDNVRFVHDKWRDQDRALEASRHPIKARHPPNQTYLC